MDKLNKILGPVLSIEKAYKEVSSAGNRIWLDCWYRSYDNGLLILYYLVFPIIHGASIKNGELDFFLRLLQLELETTSRNN